MQVQWQTIASEKAAANAFHGHSISSDESMVWISLCANRKHSSQLTGRFNKIYSEWLKYKDGNCTNWKIKVVWLVWFSLLAILHAAHWMDALDIFQTGLSFSHSFCKGSFFFLSLSYLTFWRHCLNHVHKHKLLFLVAASSTHKCLRVPWIQAKNSNRFCVFKYHTFLSPATHSQTHHQPHNQRAPILT